MTVKVGGEGVAPAINVSAASLDIGTVNVGSSETVTFFISNYGNIDLNVENIQSDNEAFTVSPTTSTVAPDDSQEVTITFSPVAAGMDSTVITIISGGL